MEFNQERRECVRERARDEAFCLAVGGGGTILFSS